jgi:hypothetical protein
VLLAWLVHASVVAHTRKVAGNVAHVAVHAVASSVHLLTNACAGCHASHAWVLSLIFSLDKNFTNNLGFVIDWEL